MRLRAVAAVGAVAAGTGLMVIRRFQRQVRGGATEDKAEPRSRWRTVTIHRSPGDVMPEGRVPEPLARLGDEIEVEVATAAGGRGTELRARLRSPEPSGVTAAVSRLSGRDRRQHLRSALRETKQLIEVGEGLRIEPVPHGPRPKTPTGKIVGLAASRAGGEGVL